jgi:hypothetical protein
VAPPRLNVGTYDRNDARSSKFARMKLFLEILISLILHPIAMILMWINLVVREDMSTFKKIIWAIVGIVWGLGPILYILVAEGALW